MLHLVPEAGNEPQTQSEEKKRFRECDTPAKMYVGSRKIKVSPRILSSTGAQPPKKKTDAPLMDLVLEMLDQSALISKALSRLQKEPNSFRASLRDELRKMVAKIDRLANGLDARAGRFSSREARQWLDLAEHIRDKWPKVEDIIDSTVNPAVQGKVDKRAPNLSVDANSGDLVAQRKLMGLPNRLTSPSNGGQVSRSAPDDLADAVDSDEDGQGGDEEQTAFEQCLSRFLRKDELAQCQALADLTGRFQGHLAARVVRDECLPNSETEKILGSLWHHAEVVLLADCHRPSRKLKLSPLLAMDKVSPYARRFKQLLSLFEAHESSRPNLTDVLAPFEASARESLLRALLIHPARAYRSYGISQLEPSQYWSVVSAAEVPVIALADIAGRLWHRDVSESYRKIFFDCTLRRLAKAQTQQQVTAARSVIERFAPFQFFLEDNYYRKMMKLNELVEKREMLLQVENSVSKNSIETLKRDKDRVGSRQTYYPKRVFAIPLSVQRKMAREGHYFKLFVRHPHPKITLETMCFVTSPGMAEEVLKTKATNRWLILEICKKPDLLGSYKARMALLANPHTPLKAGLNYIPHVNGGDLRRLAANHDINPEIRAYLARRLNH